ncbi:MAG: chromosome partition protein Smc [Pseudomonadota bacterium]|jgi:chromosome segregation protein
MRLESIKLAGFKSFVDPTTVAFPSNLTAIVGPNGCGKSNIIDAIRWVMGESSAKQLRGQSLDDVIFNGCKTRPALGKASIELNFDNSDGKLGGQYSSYTQIAIRREITREGQSIYSLNGTRCRRRDIRDIFLGTGLGPRSYAIIEQGMISRLVEAKPDELRAYIEEAAGISKYKERRRETELRLEHTQENLNRLNDLREELSKQLKHLQRQASTAERYKILKQEERLLKAQLQALRYRLFDEQLQTQLTQIKVAEEQLEQSQLEQQNLLKQITADRTQQTQARLSADQYQTQYYELGNEITRLTENLRSQTRQLEQNQLELTELAKSKIALEQKYHASETNQSLINQSLAELKEKQATLKITTEQSQSALQQAELDFKNWQAEWEKLQTALAQLNQQHRVAQTQHQYLLQQSETLKQDMARLQQEQDEQQQILNAHDDDPSDLDAALALTEKEQLVCQTEQEKITQQIRVQRADLEALIKELDSAKSHLQITQGEYASLMALQQEALGKREHTQLKWFKAHHLTELPRLVQLLKVETGWERAVEVALSQHIQAVCLSDRDSLDDFLNNPPPHTVSLMTRSTPCEQLASHFSSQLTLSPLSSKFTAPWPLEHLLAGVYAAETGVEAIKYVSQLKSYESIITREGICLGNHWIRLTAANDHKAGLLQREGEIAALKKNQLAIQVQLDKKQTEYHQQQQQLKALEAQQVSKQSEFTQLIAHHSALNTRQQVQKLRLTQAKQRIQAIQQALQKAKQHYEANQEKLQQSAQAEKLSQSELQQIEQQGLLLIENKTALQLQLDKAISLAKAYEAESHQQALNLQATTHQFETNHATLATLKQQQAQVEKRLYQLQQTLDVAEDPIESLQQNLTIQTQAQSKLGIQLKESQTQLTGIEQGIKHSEQRLQTLETNLTLDRGALEQQRLLSQELHIRAKTLEEQLHEQGYELKTLLLEIPDEKKDIAAYEMQLASVTQRIEQIGAVNLAALEEQKIISERENYLEAQYKDLIEALEILQTAIQKMDKETRNRFKETFDKVNENFTRLFPHLFSGGIASLQLQDPDLLSSGICIMAQPPGKRNSTIHLLSGGEKALTAIALVFSFFQLNPAPFCMLDEVDAPLDDTNVLRFCKLVREMSKEVQFIFISHNKVAIEMAQHLTGITMHEPGVSRMVAVDLEKAIAIANA